MLSVDAGNPSVDRRAVPRKSICMMSDNQDKRTDDSLVRFARSELLAGVVAYRAPRLHLYRTAVQRDCAGRHGGTDNVYEAPRSTARGVSCSPAPTTSPATPARTRLSSRRAIQHLRCTSTRSVAYDFPAREQRHVAPSIHIKEK